MKVGHIPLIRYRRPGDPQVAEQIAALADTVRGVLLERLGPRGGSVPVAQAVVRGRSKSLRKPRSLWLMTKLRRPAPGSTLAALDELQHGRGRGARW